MCIRWLINWSDSTKMHGATIRFTLEHLEWSSVVWILRNKIFSWESHQYTKLNFRTNWVSTDPLLNEDREHLPDYVDKNIFVSWCQTCTLFQCSPPDNALNFCGDLFSYKWSSHPSPSLLLTIRRHNCSIHSLPFGLISSFSFNLALLLFISCRQFLLTPHCLSVCVVKECLILLLSTALSQ